MTRDLSVWAYLPGYTVHQPVTSPLVVTLNAHPTLTVNWWDPRLGRCFAIYLAALNKGASRRLLAKASTSAHALMRAGQWEWLDLATEEMERKNDLVLEVMDEYMQEALHRFGMREGVLRIHGSDEIVATAARRRTDE